MSDATFLPHFVEQRELAEALKTEVTASVAAARPSIPGGPAGAGSPASSSSQLGASPDADGEVKTSGDALQVPR